MSQKMKQVPTDAGIEMWLRRLPRPQLRKLAASEGDPQSLRGIYGMGTKDERVLFERAFAPELWSTLQDLTMSGLGISQSDFVRLWHDMTAQPELGDMMVREIVPGIARCMLER